MLLSRLTCHIRLLSIPDSDLKSMHMTNCMLDLDLEFVDMSDSDLTKPN